MNYISEKSDDLFSALPIMSIVIFTLILILRALVSFITGASFGKLVTWVLDF